MISEALSAALADRYRIEEEIGAGGMATVYLAEDLRHKRKVALKVLRPDLAATLGPERFVREIEVAAQLHHPHILPLYDSGEAAGFLFFVMPYEEGQSLRERLERESELPIRDVVRFLHDVADALTHAHAHGLVHRDIKPENVMVSGRHALVTDFGVAKAVSEATGRQKLTTMGVALGTPTYMAPEQASADPNIDARADIYALGILAYELLTGQPPFMGNTPQAILAAQVSQLPRPVQEHRSTVPPALAMLVMRCLEKRPADRFQSAEELLPILESLNTPSGGVTPMGTAPYRATAAHKAANNVPYVVAAAALVAAVAWVWLQGSSAAAPTFSLNNITQVTRTLDEPELHVAIAPDGRTVAFQAGYRNGTRIVVQDVVGGRPLELTEDWGGFQTQPQWGPDGRTVLFRQDGGQDHATGQWQVPWTGGRGARLENQLSDRSLNSGYQIEIRSDSAVAIDGDGGETVLRVGTADAHSMAWSPDSGALAYVVGNADYLNGTGNIASSEIWVTPIGGKPSLVADNSSMNVSPAWLPDGTLLFVSNRNGNNSIYAVRLDGSGAPTGDPVPVAGASNVFSISVSADGSKIAYERFIVRHNIHSIAIPESGAVSIREARPLTRGNQQIELSSPSRDGAEIVFDANLFGNQDIFVMSADGSDDEPRRVTTSPDHEFSPSFSPDGSEIVFHAIRDGVRDIVIVDADGSNPTRLTNDSLQNYHPVMSHDGLTVAYGVLGPGAGIYLVSRESVESAWGDPELITAGPGYGPDWARNEATLVYGGRGSAGGGSSGIWVHPRGGEARILLAEGGFGLSLMSWPNWSSSDDRFVYFVAYAADASQGVYRIPASGGIPELVVRYDEPSMQLFSNGNFSMGNGELFMTISAIESDIYVADLVRQ